MGAARIRVRSLLAALKDQAEERARAECNWRAAAQFVALTADQLEADVAAREAVIECQDRCARG